MPGVANKPVVIVEGARIDPVIIKTVTQLMLVNSRAVPWNYERVTVTYKVKEVKEEVCQTHGLTRSGRCFAPEELRKAKSSNDNPVLVKKAVTEEEAEEFLRKMKVQDYSIVEQLRNTPAQISLLTLLIHSNEHRQALMKILNKAHIPDKISVNHLEKIANKIFEVNRVTFSDDELPMEGTEHNRALYLTIKCKDSVVTRVLVDNGSSANIFPLSTLNKLKVDDERIHKNSICVRGFDGGGKDSVGDIVLELTIGLLNLSWSSRQEIVMHSEDNLCAHSDAIVPIIEFEDDKGPWVYQVFDTVSVEKIPEGKCVPAPRVAATTVMVAVEMLKNGFVPGKALGASLQVSRRGIELDPSKIKVIRELPPPRNKTEVMSLLGRLNYISRFIAQLTTTCEPIFKLLKNDVAVKWKDECQEAFDKIKGYLSNLSVLVPPEPGRPLIMYLTVLNNFFGCVLGQHDITGRKEQAIYYKKFTSYEVKYTHLERTCCALTWVAQKLKHYLSSYTTYIISRLDPLKYIFQKPMPTWRLTKWHILLIEFDIVYVTRTAMKAQALADHLAENPVNEEYDPLKTYFPDEEVMHIDEWGPIGELGWKLFFDGAANMKGVGIGVVLISEVGYHYLVTAQLHFYWATPYLLVYGTEVVIPAEVEIPSLQIVAEAGIDDDEWVKTRMEKLSLIDEKRLPTVCHGQLYQQRMARAYNKKI
ncbi:uncharacterized protein [Nicotiana sylvestris]|uniref:uncharacterized protein n=1 Tax=Nicotiana sylvestris TaxID=4096 RepID=UPI00388CBBBC